MPTQPYRQAPTLAAALMGGGEGAPPVYQAASGVPSGVDPSLYDQAFATPDIGPRPTEDKKSLARTLIAALGDAGTTYASILGGEDIRTHNLQNYQDYLAAQKQSAENYDRLKLTQESESKRSKARFLLGRDGEAQIRAQDEAAKKALRAAAVADAQAKRDQEVADEANRRQFELVKQAQEQAFQTGLQKTKLIHDEAMAKYESRLKGGDKTAEKDLKDFSTGAQVIASFENGLPPGKDGTPAVPPLAERLKAGEDPGEIRRHLEDELDQAGIFGVPRDLVRNRFNEKMLRTNRQLQKEAEQQPPPGQ